MKIFVLFLLVLGVYSTDVSVDLTLNCPHSAIFRAKVRMLEMDWLFTANKQIAWVPWTDLKSGDHLQLSGRDDTDAGGKFEFKLYIEHTCGSNYQYEHQVELEWVVPDGGMSYCHESNKTCYYSVAVVLGPYHVLIF